MVSAAAQSTDTLKVALTNLPAGRGNVYNSTSGNPGLSVHSAIFDGLTRVDAEANPAPMLAVSWYQESKTAWIFNLRPGVVFSNGEPFNAEAVAFAVALLKAPQSQSYPVAVELRELVGADVIDELTVRIQTENVNVLLPNFISALKFVPPRYWTEIGADEFGMKPIGTGPFRVTEWGLTRIDFVRSETSWRQPKLDRLELLAAIEPSTRLQSVLSNQTDIAVSLGLEDVDPVERAGHKVIMSSDGGVQVLAFNTVRPSPLQNADVRRALNYAIDRDAIEAGLLERKIPLANQPALPGAFGYDASIGQWPYDPDRAKTMLAEAGYPNGFSFVAEIRIGLPPETTSFYQQIAADLAKIGVQLEIRAIPGPQYGRGIYDGEWQGEAVGIDYGLIPSLDALKPMYRHSCLWPKPWYCDREIIPMIEAAAAAETLEQRHELTQSVMRRQVGQAAAIFMFDIPRFDAVNAAVEGYAVEVGYIDYAAISKQRSPDGR